MTTAQAPTIETAIAVARDTGVAETTGASLVEAFRPHFAALGPLLEQAKEISVEDATQVTEIARARETRLAIRAVRTRADKTREDLKRDSLRLGNAIQGMFNVLKLATEPVEARLLEQEEFAARREAERFARLREERRQLLDKYAPEFPLPEDLAMIRPEAFERLLATAKREADDRAERTKREDEAARKREAEQQAESKRLEREAAKAKADRDAATKAAQEARDAADKAQRELDAIKERERREKAEELRKQKRAAAAPDRVKLAAIAKAVREIPMPEGLKTPEAADAARRIKRRLEATAEHIEAEIRDL